MDKIKVCGIEYQILSKTAAEMQGRIGLANFNTQEIWIGEDFTDATKRIATVHEILHIVSDAYGLDLSEHQVKYLAHALIALEEDNPGRMI